MLYDVPGCLGTERPAAPTPGRAERRHVVLTVRDRDSANGGNSARNEPSAQTWSDSRTSGAPSGRRAHSDLVDIANPGLALAANKRSM